MTTMSKRHLIACGSMSMTVTFVAFSGAAADAGAAPAAPVPLVQAAGGKAIAGRYVVVLRSDASGARSKVAVASAAQRARQIGGVVHHQYEHALSGYSASLSAAQLERIRRDPAVEFVEQDAVSTTTDVQANPTWGLDRIDQVTLPLDRRYGYRNNGAGATVFVIDTGIRATHQEFAGRVRTGFTAIADGVGTGDCNGHGTHVAGTIGGSTYGVAKAAALVPVRVFGCASTGPVSNIIAGVDWVSANHPSRSIANMSLGASADPALDLSVANLIGSGVTVVVSAGNTRSNACLGSPGRVGSAVLVAASTASDTRASFSNYGSCVDLFAPGQDILSASNASDTASTTKSGTSMAAPHVAGVAALYLADHPSASNTEVSAALVATATTGRLKSIGAGSPNRLLFSSPTAPRPGAADIVSWEASSSNFMVGQSTGSSFGWSTWLTGIQQPGAFAAGDFNGDGKADIVSWEASSSNVMVGLSTGSAFTWNTWLTGIQRPGAFAAGNFGS